MEDVVGSGNVRLLGQRGATARIDAGKPPEPVAQPALAAAAPEIEAELDLLDLADDV